jgi:predicted TIM-barrel fold metal-dependent hydrolase
MAHDDAGGVALSERASVRARPRVVDADAHADTPYEMWADYLPPNLREHAPQIEHGEDHDWIVFEGRKRPVMLISNTAGKEGKDYKMVGRRSEQRPVWLPKTRLGDMDADGMDSAVLFSNGLLATQNPELFIASFEAYNRWLWDWCGADRRRLIPVAYVPARDPDETIRFLHDVAKMGMRSVNIPAYPMARDGVSSSVKVGAVSASQAAVLAGDPSAGRSYADPEWDRFWAAAQDLDLTLTMHLGARLTRFGEKRHFLPDLVMTKVAMAEPAAIAIYNGIFPEVPQAAPGAGRERRGLDGLDGRIYGPHLGEAAFLDRKRPDQAAQLLHGPERLRLVHPRPGRHHAARPAGRAQHHVVVGLPALGDHLPPLARGDRTRLRRGARGGGARDHLRPRRAGLWGRLTVRIVRSHQFRHRRPPSRRSIPGSFDCLTLRELGMVGRVSPTMTFIKRPQRTSSTVVRQTHRN